MHTRSLSPLGLSNPFRNAFLTRLRLSYSFHKLGSRSLSISPEFDFRIKDGRLEIMAGKVVEERFLPSNDRVACIQHPHNVMELVIGKEDKIQTLMKIDRPDMLLLPYLQDLV